MSGKRSTIYIPDDIKEELEEIKKKYKVKDDKEAFIIWKALQLTGGKFGSGEDSSSDDSTKKKKVKKAQGNPASGSGEKIMSVVEEKVADVVGQALEPAIHSVRKTAEEMKKQLEKDDRPEPKPPILPPPGVGLPTPDKIEKEIERKIEEYKRKLEQEKELSEMKKTLSELKQELDWYVQGGYISKMQELKQIEDLLTQLGWSKEDKSAVIEVLQSNIPDVIELINTISNKLIGSNVDDKYYQKVTRMIQILEARAEKLERLYAEKKLDNDTYSQLIREIERAIMQLTMKSIDIEDFMRKSIKESIEDTEQEDEDEGVDDLFK